MVWITGKLVEESKKSLNPTDSSPQEHIEYGTATEPRTPRSFRGRHGIWACEACNTTTLLQKGTKQWTCKQCNALMYTTPIQECPLEKARRFILKTKDDFHDPPVAPNGQQDDTKAPSNTTAAPGTLPASQT
jgi:ribosomal protein L37AE/L43A